MGTLEAELSDGNNLVLLKGASSIGITASTETERGKGLSTVRFVIAGDEAKGEEPFATLTVWHEKGNILDLSVDHLGDRISVRGQVTLKNGVPVVLVGPNSVYRLAPR